NKPEGEICTTIDYYNRPTVFDHLPLLKESKWINVGRLDLNTQGLLLFTNDGHLANQLMHPKNKIEREYYIRVFGAINTNTMKILNQVINIKNETFKFKKIIALNNTS
ncbi:23S rRNA pseudouridylate synthase, partial [Buchnera aphidicola]|nr:23S rRNA pseudouridylate synthase [Buchnera aphidicola]